ncbi:MAG: T9SS type A sorting domain-containing protein, partial [Bacteroidota bacterium]|nr:T9SS type A sorting domain-containing protein [Bacteroidota bacterium]
SRKITGNGEYQELEFDFSSAISNFEVTSKPYLIIYVNPGQEYTGEIMVKNLNFTVYNDNAQAPELTNILPELIVYPNPVVDVVNVELPESFNGKIIVRDVSGREVYDSYIDDSFSSIAQADLSYLTTGTYFVSLVGQDYALSSRIQIN